MEGIVLHSKERYCALIALIARSHGMSLDDTEPILNNWMTENRSLLSRFLYTIS